VTALSPEHAAAQSKAQRAVVGALLAQIRGGGLEAAVKAAVSLVVAHATSVPTNWHQATVHFVLSQGC
jgi:hypothetical protein